MHTVLLAVALSQWIAGAKTEPMECWGSVDDDDPRQAVCEAVSDEELPAGVIRLVASRLRVSAETAATIAEAQLRLDAADRKRTELTQEDLSSLDRRLRTALREPGNKLPVLITIAQLVAPGVSDSEFSDQIFPLLRREPNAVPLTTRVASHLVGFRWQSLLAAALETHRDHPDLLAAMAERHPIGAAFGPGLIGPRGVTLRTTFRPLSAEVLATHAERQIGALLSIGRAGEALALFDLLPEAARTRILQQPKDTYEHVSLSLAAAAALAGDEARARLFLKNDIPSDEHDFRFEPAMKIIETALRPRLDQDVFDVMIAAARSRPSGTVDRLYAALLERGGYPTRAAEELRDAANLLDFIEKSAEFMVTAADVAPLWTIMREDAQAMRARARMLDPESVESTSLRRLLDAPRLAYFRELPMPAGVESTAIVLDPGEEPVAGFVRPVRKERYGPEIVVLATSQRLDPVGEVAAGGYWLLRSRDGGKTWSAYYTGLRDGMPYVAVPRSGLSLLDGDHVRIEVEVKEIDLDSITFPAIALQTKRSKTGIYVDFAWADLTRDSDDDGVTDLVEERVVTDPHDADSDDDGLIDGRDMLPFVPHVAVPTAMSDIVAAALYGEQPDPPAERTRFIFGARAMFAPLTLPARTIVLSDSEGELYEKKFGPLYGTTLRQFAIDRSGTRAIIELNDSWRGWTALLRKQQGKWIVEETLSSWIS